jgi:hypothetical protein
MGLSQGNPPSGVAAWYCLVDAVAIGGAAPLLRFMQKGSEWMRVEKIEKKIHERVRND